MKLLMAFVLLFALAPVYSADMAALFFFFLQQAVENSPETAQADFVALIKSGRAFQWPELSALIERGADVNARCFEGGRTALMVVAESVEAPFVLLDSGGEADKPKREALKQRRRADFARLAFLIQAGAKVNLRVNDGKNSPYLLVRVMGDTNVFSMLLEGLALEKGNPDAADDNGMRPLDYAALHQNLSAYKMLIKAGADDRAPSRALGGKSAREYLQEEALAVSGGNEEFARQFLASFGY